MCWERRPRKARVENNGNSYLDMAEFWGKKQYNHILLSPKKNDNRLRKTESKDCSYQEKQR